MKVVGQLESECRIVYFFLLYSFNVLLWCKGFGMFMIFGYAASRNDTL